MESSDFQSLPRVWSSLCEGQRSILALRQVRDEADPALLERLSADERARGSAIGSKARRIQWAEGARCRLEVRDRLATTTGARETVFTSVAHSDEWAIAVGLAAETGGAILGVGVDLELTARML